MADPAYAWLQDSLDTLHRAHWYRSPLLITSAPGPEIEINGQTLINFASNDYLGLANHPTVKQAAHQAIDQWGTGSTGSRLLSGHHPLHRELETAIADWKGTEAALVFSSGYLANVGTITALVGKRDLILGDQLIHSSLHRGAQLSGARFITYPHGNLSALVKLLETHQSHYRRTLLLTDGVFSMEGDLCPLPDLTAIATHYGCMLLVDDAHGTGVLGQTGAGIGEHFGLAPGNWIQGGTLSKALGSLGGFIAGSRTLIDFLRNRAPSWVYSTALSPADTAAALTALTLQQQDSHYRKTLWQNITTLDQALQSLGLRSTPAQSPILWLGLQDSPTALQTAQQLRNQGIFAPAIRPPTVPTSGLRLSLMSSHTPAHLERLQTILSAKGIGNRN